MGPSIKDVGIFGPFLRGLIFDTPLPHVGISTLICLPSNILQHWDPPPPLKYSNVFYGWPLCTLRSFCRQLSFYLEIFCMLYPPSLFSFLLIALWLCRKWHLFDRPLLLPSCLKGKHNGAKTWNVNYFQTKKPDFTRYFEIHEFDLCHESWFSTRIDFSTN